MKFVIINIFIVINMLFTCVLSAQPDAYRIEQDGYFVHPVYTQHGIIVSDNYCSKIYLVNNDSLSVLIDNPGCGRFFTVSPDKDKIGFKWIYANGMQAPAVYDLNKHRINFLHDPVEYCGQVSFSDNGAIAFTIGEHLLINTEKGNSRFHLGHYANIAPISPDGRQVVFNDDKDRIIVLTLKNGNRLRITSDDAGFVYPHWAPDSKKIVYSSLSGYLFVYDLRNGQNYKLGKGGNAVWKNDATHLLFQVSEAENFNFDGSDLYMSDFKGDNVYNISKSEEIHEMSPSLANSNTIVYHTYNKRQIFKAALNTTTKKSQAQELIYSHEKPLEIAFKKTKQLKKLKATVKIKGVPYIHQVYDTPDFHDGSGSCAPTTAVMALVHLNILPKWPVEVSHLTPHVSNYGSYIADMYHFNGIYYNTYTSPYGSDSWGAYSYMWNGSSPGQGRMRSYLENHGVTSNQDWTTNCTFEKTIAEIDSGYTHPVCSWITQAGHLTLAVGYVEGQHTLIFNDPYGNKNTAGYPSYDGKDAYYDWPGYNNGYQNLDPDGSHGGIAWTVLTRKQKKNYQSMTIDDIYFDKGFYIYNESPSHMKYYRDEASGYNDHMWWTYSVDEGDDVCYVTWTPSLDTPGVYNVMTYIPEVNAEATNVAYVINFSNGDTTVYIDQNDYAGEWVGLGQYYFNTSDTGYVYLGDVTGTAGEKIAYDAVKWQKGELSYSIITDDVSCFGMKNGKAEIKIEKGNDPFSYSWSHDLTNISSIANGLSEGNYKVTVADADNNILSMPFTITGPDSITISFTTERPSSVISKDGKILADATGGTPPYSYTWSNGTNVAANNNVPVGVYRLVVTDFNGCIKESKIELINDIKGLVIGPNPFSDFLKIAYKLEESGRVNISIYDLDGRKEKILVDSYQEKGIHEYSFNQEVVQLARGMYIIKFRSAHQEYSKKLVKGK